MCCGVVCREILISISELGEFCIDRSDLVCNILLGLREELPGFGLLLEVLGREFDPVLL